MRLSRETGRESGGREESQVEMVASLAEGRKKRGTNEEASYTSERTSHKKVLRRRNLRAKGRREREAKEEGRGSQLSFDSLLLSVGGHLFTFLPLTWSMYSRIFFFRHYSRQRESANKERESAGWIRGGRASGGGKANGPQNKRCFALEREASVQVVWKGVRLQVEGDLQRRKCPWA